MLPDLLEQARECAAKRSGAHAYVLPAGREADFRLDAPPDRDITFQDGEALACVHRQGRIYVRMLPVWYEKTAVAWNALPLPDKAYKATSPNEFLCLQLLHSPDDIAPIETYIPLIRACMELPHILRRGKPQLLCREINTLCSRLRMENARALAAKTPRYALRACACALFLSLTNDSFSPTFF